MSISGDVFRINQVYELLQEGQWPLDYFFVINYYGWFSGASISTVDRIDFAADTETASVRGPLNLSRTLLAATGNDNYGWFGGGISGPGPVTATISRITYVTDTATSTSRGSLTLARFDLAATGNDNYGWFGGGRSPGSSRIDRIDFTNDNTTASLRGPLAAVRYSSSATGNDNYGWFGGGFGLPGRFSSVDRIDFANDNNTASVRSPLTLARFGLTATGNNNYGWFGGGYTASDGQPSSRVVTVDRIDFTNDTSVSGRGPLSLARGYLAGASNDNYGWFAGGAPGSFSRVDRIDFLTDNVTASIRGPLSIGRTLSATSGTI